MEESQQAILAFVVVYLSVQSTFVFKSEMKQLCVTFKTECVDCAKKVFQDYYSDWIEFFGRMCVCQSHSFIFHFV